MSNETMKKEYPDEKQRVAICIGQATADCDCIETADYELQMEAGYAEELTEENFYVPSAAEYEDFGEETEEWDIAGEKPGLWENIRKKKERLGKKYKPAKPGDPDRPDPKSWKKAQSDGGDAMALEQIQKMHDQLMEIVMKLKGMELSVEFQDWTKDMISKAEIYVQNVYDFVKYYEPGKYEDEYTGEEEEEEEEEDTEQEDTEEPEMEYGEYEYKDPQTGEIYTYNRRGYYEKDGRVLIYMGKAEEYQGRKVTLNKPFRTPSGPKKFAVYVKNESGNVVIVRFGDPNMKIKKNIPERRKSFRARHNCDNPGPKWKARYWACKSW
jgi:NACalpha-BTF3-like transcription factor